MLRQFCEQVFLFAERTFYVTKLKEIFIFKTSDLYLKSNSSKTTEENGECNEESHPGENK